jgi:dTDP-4-dehydrorhamnose reductase
MLRLARSEKELRVVRDQVGGPTAADDARVIVGEVSPRVVPIRTADIPRPARRPGHSVLDCSRIASVFGIAQPDWRVSLAGLCKTLGL